jgi:catechol 2,3-dioxygenase-like lactoylglutathione lyase family enzyme
VFDHVTIRVSDRAASERFYGLVLAALDAPEVRLEEAYAEWDDFSLAAADAARPATQRLHLGFTAPSRTHVDACWERAVAAGYHSDGEPGPRPQYRNDYYGAFLLDPDGNSVEAVHHGDSRADGVIDHLWLRVADVAASARFYATVAPHAGLRVREAGERTMITGAQGSFSVLHGEPTRHLHLAFPARTNLVVDAFWADATGAGYRDNGRPGERPEYHPGYYGAFVLDPDGNNIEVVCHNRERAAPV